MKLTGSRKALLIVNPISGQGKALRNTQRIVDHLTRCGLHIDLSLTSRRGDAADAAYRASQNGHERVIVAAGDGTINEVVNVLTGTEVPIAVIPMGTGNVYALDARIPVKISRACEIAAEENVRTVDVGLANGSKFLLMAGIGFDAHVVHHVPPELKKRLKDFAYLVTSFQKFFHWKASRFHVHLDTGETLNRRAWLAMVGNAASYAWNIKVTSLAQMDDGLLDFCLFPGRSKLAHVRQVVRTLLGQHIQNGEVEYRKVRSLTVEADPPVPVQLDGDTLTCTPVKIEIIPMALKVIVPAT